MMHPISKPPTSTKYISRILKYPNHRWKGTPTTAAPTTAAPTTAAPTTTQPPSTGCPNFPYDGAKNYGVAYGVYLQSPGYVSSPSQCCFICESIGWDCLAWETYRYSSTNYWCQLWWDFYSYGRYSNWEMGISSMFRDAPADIGSHPEAKGRGKDKAKEVHGKDKPDKKPNTEE